MTLRKSYVALITIFLTSALCSCDGYRTDGCEGARPYISNYTIEGYSGVFLSYERKSGEDVEQITTYNEGDLIESTSFAIKLESEAHWENRNSRKAGEYLFSVSLFQSAYACSPAEYYIPNQRITNLSIVSTGSFGAKYPSGANLVELFDQSSNHPSVYQVNRYVEGELSSEEIPMLNSIFRLNAIPEDEQHIFTLAIELDDGAYFEVISPQVAILANAGQG